MRWFALLMFSFFFSVSSWAADLTVAFGQFKPPFIFGKTQKGIEIDIFREALHRRGHTLGTIIHTSNQRLQENFQSLGADAVAAVPRTNNDLYFSDLFIAYDNYAIVKKSSNLVLNSPKDLVGVRTLAWTNAWRDLGEEFEALFGPSVTLPYRNKYKEHANQGNQSAMFWKDRTDVLIMDKVIFYWYRKLLASEMDTTDEVILYKPFISLSPFYAGFKEQQIRDDFNFGLRSMQQDGTYQKLFEKYQ